MSDLILCDMHVHSKSSHDSLASVCDTAIFAINNNASAFAITDHCDIEFFNEHNVFSLIESSFNETTEALTKFKDKIKILRGVELGEAIWNMDYTNKILNFFDFDVVIASVHAVRYKNYTAPYSTLDFSKMSKQDIDGYMNVYFDDVLKTVKCVSCDIIAHLTCPLRYINGKYGLNIESKKYESKIIPILKYIIDNSIAMEINTSGIGSAYDCFLPENWIIEKFKEMGGYLVTLGSDAHISENLCKDFQIAISTLKKFGFTDYYYFENRKAIKCSM